MTHRLSHQQIILDHGVSCREQCLNSLPQTTLPHVVYHELGTECAEPWMCLGYRKVWEANT